MADLEAVKKEIYPDPSVLNECLLLFLRDAITILPPGWFRTAGSFLGD
jgi:hypothetical protein